MAPSGKQDIAHVLALGPLQRGLYSLNRMLHSAPARPPGHAEQPDTGGPADIYAIAVLTDFHGPLDTERLRRALTEVLARHPQLLARFWDEGLPHPVQLVPAVADFPWREVEMTAQEFQAYVRTAQYQPFDLAEGPPLRATLAALGPDHHRLLVVFHHIVLDGWSVPLFWRELADRYQGDGCEPVLPSPAYPEYIGWLQRRDRQGSLRRWREMLSGVDEPTVVASTAPPGEPWTLVVDDALREVFPQDSEPDAAQPYPLELVCAVHPGVDGPVVEALWRYEPGICDAGDIHELAALWRGALDALAVAVAEDEGKDA